MRRLLISGAGREGRKAYRDGLPLSANPYLRWSEEHGAWGRGWTAEMFRAVVAGIKEDKR